MVREYLDPLCLSLGPKRKDLKGTKHDSPKFHPKGPHQGEEQGNPVLRPDHGDEKKTGTDNLLPSHRNHSQSDLSPHQSEEET